MTAWEGGKGSAPRPLSVDGDTFASNWDRIFGQDCKGRRMGCKACERRRKALAERRAKAKARGRKVEAAAIGAVLAASEAVGKAINGEARDEQDRAAGSGGAESDGGSDERHRGGPGQAG